MTEMCLSRPGEAGLPAEANPAFMAQAQLPWPRTVLGPARDHFCLLLLSLRLLSFALSFIISLSRAPSPLLPPAASPRVNREKTENPSEE